MYLEHLKKALIVFGLFLETTSYGQHLEFETLSSHFFKTYTELRLPPLEISYVANLKNIKSLKEIRQQEDFFLDMKKRLSELDTSLLTGQEEMDFRILQYETNLNLERIELEKQWMEQPLDPDRSIFTLPNGKKWYAYLLKKWVDAEINPKMMLQSGLDQIDSVKAKMKKIREASGMADTAFKTYLSSESFHLNNEEELQYQFELLTARIMPKIREFFPYMDSIPKTEIKPAPKTSGIKAPAYYKQGTFYYSTDRPFHTRKVAWLFLHEAIPGHHYQTTVNGLVTRSDIQKLFWYPGFAEGWGAYVEILGKELKAYNTIYDEYGKWEWELIRSVRAVLDVGINYHGWSNKKAMRFWNRHVENQTEIGKQEIERVKRWPAQAFTYTYGAHLIGELLSEARKKPDFDYKLFHTNILRYGEIPLSILCERYDWPSR